MLVLTPAERFAMKVKELDKSTESPLSIPYPVDIDEVGTVLEIGSQAARQLAVYLNQQEWAVCDFGMQKKNNYPNSKRNQRSPKTC